MFRKCGIVLLALVLTGALAACGGTNNMGDELTPDRSANGFTLNVWDESYVDGGKASGYALEVEDFGDDIVVAVQVEGAEGLKALYFDMEYDADTYSPSGVRPLDGLVEVDELIQMTYLGDRGTVYHGQVAPNYQWREGLDGDATVARVLFHKGAAQQVRSVSAAPSSGDSRTTCEMDGTNVNWLNFNQGDYDQNGEVNIADLSPIGANFSTTGAQDDITSALSVIDGDRNGEINIADLSPIGANFFTAISGWRVYSAATEGDIPTAATDGNGANTLLGLVELSEGVGNTSAVRIAFSYDATGVSGWIYVRAIDNDATPNEGVPSIGVETGGSGSNVVLTLVNPPNPTPPFIADVTTDYEFQVTDNSVDPPADVTMDVSNVWTVSNVAAGAVDTSGAVPTLNIEDTFVGSFTVRVSYDGALSNSVHMEIVGPTVGVFIQPDAADAQWTAIPGAGTSADPFILESTAPHDEEYSLEAFQGTDNTGDAIDVSTLTWHADPEFLVSWPVEGSFVPNQFTNTPVFANDGTLTSNMLYVVIQGLPT